MELMSLAISSTCIFLSFGNLDLYLRLVPLLLIALEANPFDLFLAGSKNNSVLLIGAAF